MNLGDLAATRDRLSVDPRWRATLLPLCDWGRASWSCLDCGGEDGAIVTVASEGHLVTAGHTLRSWLCAWLDGVDLERETFEPPAPKAGIHPFTGQPTQAHGRGRGQPRGRPWP